MKPWVIEENHISHWKNQLIESELQSYLQAQHCERTSECFNKISVSDFCINYLRTTDWKSWKAVQRWGVGYLKLVITDMTAGLLPPLIEIHRSPVHYSLVLKSSSSSIKLYTYTKLRTPVFIVKRCYAYLYCMYVYPSALELCSFIYPKVKCINNQYFEAKCLQLL